MTKTTPTLKSPCRERHLTDVEINIQELNHAASSALANIIADVWMFAINYSFFHYVIVGSIVRNNVDVVDAIICALRSTDADGFEEKRDDSMDRLKAPSVGDLLASDQRSMACKTLGGALETSLTRSIRRDLIVASSVVC